MERTLTCLLLLLSCSLCHAGGCLPQMNILDACTTSQCTSVNAQCTSGKCTCATGYQAVNNYCVQTSQVSLVLAACGTTCPSFTSCDASNKCTCLTGYLAAADNSQCYLLLPKLGQQCTATCDGDPIVQCDSVTRTCTCQVGYVAVGLKCRLQAKLVQEKTCTYDSQCPINSYCATTTGMCTCNTGYKQTKNSNGCIVDRKKLGATCSTTVQCPVNGECDSTAKCACLRGYRQSGDFSCVAAQTILQQSCQSVSECGLFTKCESTKCMCIGNEYVASSNDIDCEFNHVKLGDYCYMSSQCPVNSFCDNKQCKCSQGFEQRPSSTDCTPIPPVAIGVDCNGAAVFCPTNGYCDFINDTYAYCDCKPGYLVSSNLFSCTPDKKKVTEACYSQDQCPLNANCDVNSRLCACAATYEASAGNTVCVKIVRKLHESCTVDSDCLGDPLAVQCETTCSTCLCRAGYVEQSGVCVARTPPAPDATPKNLYEQCANDIQCGSKDSNSNCNVVYNLCMCKPGYIEQSKKCVLDGSKLYETCSTAEQCSFTNGDCINGVCRCKMGYYLDATTSCVLDRLASFDDACLGDDQCPGDNAMCFLDKTLCQCKPGYVIDPNTRSCKLDSQAVDFECYATFQCPSNAECKQENPQKVCRCLSGYAATDDGKCFAPQLGANCTNGVCGKNALCGSNSLCFCPLPFVGMDGRCLNNLGMACAGATDCTHIAHAECSKTTNTCECVQGYITDEIEYEINQCAVVNGATVISSAPIFMTVISLLLFHLQQ